jgi:hypothetical protein
MSGANQPLLNDEARHDNSPFGLTADQLTKLVDPKNPGLLKQLGGPTKICSALRVDPKVGLRTDERLGGSDIGNSHGEPFAERAASFGRNVGFQLFTILNAFEHRFTQRIFYSALDTAGNTEAILLVTFVGSV